MSAYENASAPTYEVGSKKEGSPFGPVEHVKDIKFGPEGESPQPAPTGVELPPSTPPPGELPPSEGTSPLSPGTPGNPSASGEPRHE